MRVLSKHLGAFGAVCADRFRNARTGKRGRRARSPDVCTKDVAPIFQDKVRGVPPA